MRCNTKALLAIPLSTLLTSCLLFESSNNEPHQPEQQFTPRSPEKASDLKNYFKPIRLFTDTTKGSLSDVQANPDCVQYLRLLNLPSAEQCAYLSEWKLPTTTAPGSARNLRDVWSALKICENGACSPGANSTDQTGNFLVMGLKSRYHSSGDVPLLSVEHGQPLSAFVYLLHVDREPQNSRVYILNPDLLNYEIIAGATSGPLFSLISKDQLNAGWFLPSFLGYDEGRISDQANTIRLAAVQSEIRIASSGSNPATPQMKVVVYPASTYAMMPEFKAGVVLSDARQQLIRGATFHGPVNVTGELKQSHTDLSYPLSSSPFSLSIGRSYASFNTKVGAFGRNWDSNFLMNKRNYALITPTGSVGNFEFLASGDGRQFLLPDLARNDPGPFWPKQEPENALNPDPRASGLLQTFNSSLALQNDRDNIRFDLMGRLISKFEPMSKQYLYQVYNGGLQMVFDHLASSNTASVLQDVLANFAAAETQYRSGEFLRAIQLNQPNVRGNFLYFVRNSKGFIEAIFDKSGFITKYEYQGDNLRQVQRLTQDEQGRLKTTNLWTYSYTGLENEDPQWSALLTEVKVPEREQRNINLPVLKEIKYEIPQNTYAQVPYVKELKTDFSTISYSYNLKLSRPSETSTTIATETSGSKVKKYTYSWDDRGFVVEAKAPTESAQEAVIYRAVMDPKLLQVIHVVTRSGATLMDYSRETGNLLSLTSCSDRSQRGSDQSLQHNLAQIASDGSIRGLSCNGAAARRSTRFVGSRYRADFFRDLSASQVAQQEISDPLTLPQSQGGYRSITPRISRVFNGCFGGTGQMTVQGAKSGVFCATSSLQEGQAPQLVMTSLSDFSDGTLKSKTENLKTTNEDHNQILFSQSDTQVTSRLKETFYLMSRTNQRGFLESSNLATRTDYSPRGNQITTFSDASRNISRVFRDIYGNIIFEKNSAGAETYYLYDYSKASAVLINTFTKGAFIPDHRDSQTTSALFTLEAAPSNQGGEMTDMKAELQRALGRNPVRRGALDVFSMLQVNLDSRGLPESVFGVGSTTTYRRDALGRVIAATTTSPTSPAQISQTQPDQSTGKILETIDASGTKTTFEYDLPNGEVSKITTSFLNQGASSVQTSVTRFDWAGRPLETQVLKTAGISQADGGPDSNHAGTVTTTYSYYPFGEIYQVSTTEGGYTTTKTFERDITSGILLSESTSTTGLNAPADTQTLYRDFDSNLIARTIIDESTKLTTKTIGVPGKDETTEIWGPETPTNLSSQKLYSKTRSLFDGCGNEVQSETFVSSQSSLKILRQVDYIKGCRVISETDAQGLQKIFGYNRSGQTILINGINGDSLLGNEDSLTFFATYPRLPVMASPNSSLPPDSLSEITITAGKQKSGPDLPVQMVIQSAQLSESAGGLALESKQYLASETVSERQERPDLFSVKQLLNLSSAASNYRLNTSTLNFRGQRVVKDSVVQAESKQKIDPFINQVTYSLSEALDPTFNNAKRSLREQTDFDPIGRNIYQSSEKALNSQAITITETYPVAWNSQGLPTEMINQIAIKGTMAGTGHIQEIGRTTYSGSYPTSITRERHYPGASAAETGISSMQVDGLGRTLQTNYIDLQPSDANFTAVITSRQIERDLTLRPTQAVYTTDDGTPMPPRLIAGLETMPFIRAMKNSTLNISYSYPVTQKGQASQMMMTLDHLTLTYDLVKGLGSTAGMVTKVRVNHPGQAPSDEFAHVFRSSVDSKGVFQTATSPYPDNMDRGTGMLVPETSIWNIWSWLTGVKSFKIEAQSILPFKGPLDFGIDTEINVPTSALKFSSSGVLKEISPTLKDFNIHSQIFFSFMSGDVPRSKNASRITSCDNALGLASNHFEPSESLGDRYNEQGRLSRAERTFSESLSDDLTRHFKVESMMGYHDNGQLARTEEVLWLKDPSNEHFADDFKVARVVKKKFFYVDSPLATIGGGAASLLMKMDIEDSGPIGDYTQFASGDSLEGSWYFIYADRTAPVMAIRNQGDSYQRYDLITDGLGNVQHLYPLAYDEANSTDRVPPQLRATYLPFYSSVITDFDHSKARRSDTVLTHYEVSRPEKTKTYLATDPRFNFPNAFIFGAQGFYQDALGLIYPSGIAYNPFTGQVMTPESSDDEICAGSPNAIRLAKRNLESETMQETDPLGHQIRSFVPNIQHENSVAEALDSYLQGLGFSLDDEGGWGRGYSGFFGGRLLATERSAAEQQFLRQNGQEWFYERNMVDQTNVTLGNVSLAVSSIAFIGAGGLSVAATKGMGAALATTGVLAGADAASYASGLPIPLSGSDLLFIAGMMAGAYAFDEALGE